MKQGFVSIGSESQVTDHRGHPEFIRTEQKRRNDNNKPAKSGSSGEARFKNVLNIINKIYPGIYPVTEKYDRIKMNNSFGDFILFVW